MPVWTLVNTDSTQGRTFQRPLDALEICFLWDGFFNRTEDSVHHYEVALSESDDSQDTRVFSEENIVRAWLSTKRRFPLAGAMIRGADGAPLRFDEATNTKADVKVDAGFASEPHLVVGERDLTVLRPDEIVFGSVASAEEAQQQALAIIRGSCSLSTELLAKLYVFREASCERTNACVLHFMVVLAHCVTDGAANRTFMRCMLDSLARCGEPEPAQASLEERLAMAVPPMDLEPDHIRSLSPAIRRWRRVVGIVILQLRMAKLQGGHTLPCRLVRSTPLTPARPGLLSISLTETQTAAVIANCRLHGFTFGNAYLVLAQVAMTRVLFRRYLAGEISEEEWEYRKRQPHITAGPLSLRRYLNKAWFDRGGGGEFMLCISLFIYQLPFMTLGVAAGKDQCILSDGAPPFSDLLTFDRFLHRVRLVKKQATAFFSHPLFLEIVQAMHLQYVPLTRHRTLQWIQSGRTVSDCDAPMHATSASEEVLPVTDIPLIWSHGGSSLGNIDLISPTVYPLPSNHPLSPYSLDPHPIKVGYVTTPPPASLQPGSDAKPSIVVKNSRVYLHPRPAELFLNAATSRERMNMYVYYDGNVFEDEVVREWLDEVREAALWYLGSTQCQ